MEFDMCFDVTASFVTGGALLPIGIYCLGTARAITPGHGLPAAFPLLFGMQQGFEGFLRLAPGGQPTIDAHVLALCYLFFAYFLWPFLVPPAAWRLETDLLRRRAFLVIGMLGFVFGAALYLPLPTDESLLGIELVHGSILYESVLLFDPVLPRYAIRAIYALLVAVPLVSSSDRAVRLFGAFVLGSVIVSAIVFEYAFVSIWCFFAAVISVYIAFLLHHVAGEGRRTDAHARATASSRLGEQPS